MMVIGDLNLETIQQSRTFATFLPLNNSRRSAQIIARPEVICL